MVLAIFADVALWWLARTCDEWGPYFAWGIIGTGTKCSSMPRTPDWYTELQSAHGRKSRP